MSPRRCSTDADSHSISRNFHSYDHSISLVWLSATHSCCVGKVLKIIRPTETQVDIEQNNSTMLIPIVNPRPPVPHAQPLYKLLRQTRN